MSELAQAPRTGPQPDPPTDPATGTLAGVRAELAALDARCRTHITRVVVVLPATQPLLGVLPLWPGRVTAALAMAALTVSALLLLAARLTRPAPAFTAQPRTTSTTPARAPEGGDLRLRDLLARKRRLSRSARTAQATALALAATTTVSCVLALLA